MTEPERTWTAEQVVNALADGLRVAEAKGIDRVQREFYRQAAAAMDAFAAQIEQATWRPIATAPKDGTRVVLATAGGSVVLATYANIGDDTFGWTAVNEDEHPDSWTDGFCWHSNADEEPSDPPVSWLPAPPARETGKEG